MVVSRLSSGSADIGDLIATLAKERDDETSRRLVLREAMHSGSRPAVAPEPSPVAPDPPPAAERAGSLEEIRARMGRTGPPPPPVEEPVRAR